MIRLYMRRQPVTRMRITGAGRPRDSHDLRLIQTNLNLSPPATLRWSHDVFGNSIAIVSFAEPSLNCGSRAVSKLETGPRSALGE